MDWSLSLCLSIALMLLLFFAGVPVFVTFLIINIGGVLWLLGGSGFGLFANSIYQTITTGALAAVPLFVLMGEILFRSGTIEILIASVDKLVGRFRGRDYVLVSSLSVLFGALCGSTTAVAALLGRTIMPAMKEQGYEIKLTSGVMLGGATLAAIIPPSALVVILGSLVDVSIASLLIAGLIPGVLLALLILGYTYIRVLYNPKLEPAFSPRAGNNSNLAQKFLALAMILPFGLVIFFVMGLIMLGIATPSESAATGVVGAIIAAAVYRRLSLRLLLDSFLSTVCISAMILIIMVSSQLFGQLLAFIGATSGLMQAITRLDFSSGWMFLILMIVPFILCMFIDLFAVMFVAVPVYLPLVKHFHFEPVWFWMLLVINLALGAMTPPFGYTLFALKGAADVELNDIYLGAWPVVFIFLLGMIIMYYLPPIITFLPRLF
ncbi:MAG: TRAP transporter large permease subunit [Thermodesulfobacteriota bacterium]